MWENIVFFFKLLCFVYVLYIVECNKIRFSILQGKLFVVDGKIIIEYIFIDLSIKLQKVMREVINGELVQVNQKQCKYIRVSIDNFELV